MKLSLLHANQQPHLVYGGAENVWPGKENNERVMEFVEY